MTILLDAGDNTATWQTTDPDGLLQSDFAALPHGRLKTFLTTPYPEGTGLEAYTAMMNAVAANGVFNTTTPMAEDIFGDSCLGEFFLGPDRRVRIGFAGYPTNRIVKVTMTYSADA